MRSSTARNRGVPGAAQLGQTPNLAHEQLVALVPDRPVIEKRRRGRRDAPPSTARRRSADSRQTRSAVRSAGPLREEPIERRPGDQPPLEQRRQPLPRPRDAELRKHERDVGIGPRLPRQDAQRLIERVLDEPRHFGLVRQVETRGRDRLRAETPAAATGRTHRSC